MFSQFNKINISLGLHVFGFFVLIVIIGVSETSGQIPLRKAMDFDGDNKADSAIFRISSSTFHISKSDGGTISQPFAFDESINPKIRSYNYNIPARGDDIVFWKQVSMDESNPKLNGNTYIFEELFHAHGGFFQPTRSHNKELPVVINSILGSGYPTNVVAENYFKNPASTDPEIILATSQLTLFPVNKPPGYSNVLGTTYKISVNEQPSIRNSFTMQQATSGKQVVRFKVANPNIPFNAVRILHSETDDFEPYIRKWIDRTILTGTYAPDATNRIISAEVPRLGVFALATYSQALNQLEELIPTDLKLTGSVTPTSVAAGTNAVYSFAVNNQGSSVAQNVIINQTLDSSTMLLSAVSSTGFCHNGDGHPLAGLLHESTESNEVFCNLGDLPVGGVATITITVKTSIFGDGIVTTPITVDSQVSVSSEEIDTNPTDNEISIGFNAIPSSNKPPKVSITNLVQESVFVTSAEYPVIIPVMITATDEDGIISEVKVYDSGEFAGNAISNGGGSYTFNLSTLRTGYHNISAVAKDNAERQTGSSNIKILVNSPHTLSIVKPTAQRVVPGSNIEIETNSSLAGNRLQKIEVYDSGILLGKLRSVSNVGNVYKYKYTLNNVSRGLHSLTAILTDLNGATTISQPFAFKATILPTITLTAPNDGLNFARGSSVDITAQVADADGYVKEVKFFANGSLIGTKSESIVKGTTTYSWISPDDGVYSISATATDDTDETITSPFINIGVNRPAPAIGEMIWVDDQIPSAVTSGRNDGWNWINRNPVALMGNSSHQSLLLTGEHEHYFEDSGFKLQVNAGKKLSAWIFMEPDYAPAEIMLMERRSELGTSGILGRKSYQFWNRWHY